jgi:hypothetical protein
MDLRRAFSTVYFCAIYAHIQEIELRHTAIQEPPWGRNSASGRGGRPHAVAKHEKTPPAGGVSPDDSLIGNFASKLVHVIVDLLFHASNPVLDAGKPAVEAGFGGVDALLHPLE